VVKFILKMSLIIDQKLMMVFKFIATQFHRYSIFKNINIIVIVKIIITQFDKTYFKENGVG
jgi:hypothetical protein